MTSSSDRPPYRQWRALSLVVIGGSIGSGLRAGLTLLIPESISTLVATLAVNMLGAFFLGLLLEALPASGLDAPHRRGLWLLFGTELLGGFTTYSALAMETVQLGLDGLMEWAIAYALVSVVAGVGMSVAGLAMGQAFTAKRRLQA